MPVAAILGCGMPNRVQPEIVDGKTKGRKFEFSEHDTFILGGCGGVYQARRTTC